MGPEGCVPVTPPLGRLSLGQAVHLHSPLERPVPHRVLPALLSSTSLLAAFLLPRILLWPLLSSVTQEQVVLPGSVLFPAAPGPCFSSSSPCSASARSMEHRAWCSPASESARTLGTMISPRPSAIPLAHLARDQPSKPPW